MKPLCIYHDGCDDGFASAWIVKQATGDLFDFYPSTYQKDPPDVTDRDVLMVDFSYKKPTIEKMREQANSILILDHHKTAQEDLAEYPLAPSWAEWILQFHPGDIAALFDMNRCGATITWDHFYPHTERPLFIEYIEDRDLWRKQLPYGDEFTIALRSYPQKFGTWNGLVANGVSSLIAEGTSILRYYRARCEELKRMAQGAYIDNISCKISNCPHFAASEVAGALAEEATFGACWYISADGICRYSLRSVGDFDVSEIAKRFGGGGHKNAAGFVTLVPIHTPAH